MTTYGRIDIAFTHGEGSYLFSEDGKNSRVSRNVCQMLHVLQVNQRFFRVMNARKHDKRNAT